ncbi:hypothetical protein [Faecalimonas sp.]
MQEETKMDKLTTEFAEYICDHLCKYPTLLSETKLEDKCLEYKIGQFICDILNEYNQELKERDTAKKIEIINGGTPACPVCSAKVFRHYEFCKDCGQKLDWSN